jgi:hypothetical protein
MAQADLHRLLEDISTELRTSLRENVDTFPHVLEISARHVEKHLSLQLAEITQPGRKAKTHVLATRYRSVQDREQAEAGLFSETDEFLQGQTAAQAKKIQDLLKRLSEEYAIRVYRELAGKSKNYQLEKIGSDTEYTLKVTYVGPKVTLASNKPEFLQKNPADVFRHIRENGLAPARDYIRTSLRTQLKGLLPSSFAKETIFDLGHITAVSTIKINKAISRLEQLRKTATYTKIMEDTLEFQIFSKFSKFGQPEVVKDFAGHVAYARPEAATYNNWQATYEANLLKEVQQAFQKVLGAKADWASQGGSDSVVEFIAKDILAHAAKRGARVQAAQLKKDLKANKAKKKDAARRKEVTSVYDGNRTIDVPEIDNVTSQHPSAVNIRTLIPILNQRLPEIVKANMGQGGKLVNRTGRFAESTEIIDIGDNAVITYSYMKSPYQVFESNSARDPRTLIDQSIRELARGIITNKFTTRRI